MFNGEFETPTAIKYNGIVIEEVKCNQYLGI